MGMFDLGWLMTGANQQLSSSVVNGGRRRREEGRSEAHPSIHPSKEGSARVADYCDDDDDERRRMMMSHVPRSFPTFPPSRRDLVT